MSQKLYGHTWEIHELLNSVRRRRPEEMLIDYYDPEKHILKSKKVRNVAEALVFLEGEFENRADFVGCSFRVLSAKRTGDINKDGPVKVLSLHEKRN